MIQGFLLGISTTFSCAAVCGPMLLSFLISGSHKRFIPLINFLIGRFIAYLAFGFLSGYTGIYFEGRIDPLIFHILMIALALWLIAYALGNAVPHNLFCSMVTGKTSNAFFPFFAGLVFGLNICPPFLLAMGQTIAYASIVRSILFFMGFFVGSSGWVLVLVLVTNSDRLKLLRNIGRVCAFGVGIWYLANSLIFIIRIL